MIDRLIKNVKKILIFSLNYYPKFIGGAEIAIKEITDRINPKEYSFDMVTIGFDSDLPKVEKIGNVTVYRVGFTKKGAKISDLKKFPLHLNKFIFQFSAAKKANDLHLKNNYDAVWAMMAHSCAVPAVLFKKKFPKVKYILTLQEGDPISHIKSKMIPLYLLFIEGFKRADIVQTISLFLGKWARDMGFGGPLEIIPNAVNVKHFSQIYPEKELEILKQKLGKKDNDIYLITTSRLVPKNALNDVIGALAYLPDEVQFIILGIGPDEDDLKKLAKSLGVESRVKFLGQVDHQVMPKYLKISDIFIRPSLSEGMGNSFIEAMAAELPVIATQEGGISDFLFDPIRNPNKLSTGRAVNIRDPKGIANTVNKFLQDKRATVEIIKNAKNLVLKKYDWNLIASDMKERVFDRVFIDL